MLPRFDVEVRIDEINPELLRVIWIDEVAEGIGDNRLYGDVTGTNWSEVEPVIAAEEALLKAAESNAVDAADFERIVRETIGEQYPGDDFDEGPLSAFLMLDGGVMAAVAALSAAGCVPTTSCNGNYGHGEPHPSVRFSTDECRLPLIRYASARSGCGLIMDSLGMLQVYAADVLAMVEFARQMAAFQHDFEAIDSEVACERPDDEYLYEYDDDLRRRDLHAVHNQMQRDQVVECPGQLSLFGDED